MNQQNSQTNWEKRLQEIEAEVNATSETQEKTNSEKEAFPSVSVSSDSSNFSTQAKGITLQVRRWFDSLPLVGKVVVGAVGVGISLSLLKTVFQLITSVLTLGIIGALGYVGYQVFIKSQNNTNQS